tara:strand:- start:3611 stop:4300 length:690 start_codon:yes stop_codon:yes gene_type:complete
MDKNSKVIIIGNSPSVLNYEYGSIIDSYDVVIRINRCLTTGFEKYIGSKTDIWATTKNTYYKDNFVPNNYDKLSYIWYRTPTAKKNVKVKKQFKNLNIPYLIMSKHRDEKKLKISEFFENCTLLGKKHPPCTGLLAILTAVKLYSDITIHGFSFYGESDGAVQCYYRDSELKDGKHHAEDVHWLKNKNSGFAGRDIGLEKAQIVFKLIDDGEIKILNNSELDILKNIGN